MLTSEQFRRVKNTVLSEALKPFGFYRGKTMFFRERDEQIHSIGVQIKQVGGMYIFNLGFTYSFLPSFFSFARASVADMDLLDFLMFCRPNSITNGPEVWRSHEVPRQQCENDLIEAAPDLVAILDVYSAKWQDPRDLVKSLPPTHVRNHINRVCNGESADPVVQRVLRGWFIDPFNVCYFLSATSLRDQRSSLAMEYADIALSLNISDVAEQHVRKLREEARLGGR